MLGLDQRGVAAITVMIIIVAGAGAGVATPVVVDVADVDPDHPLYGLERLGERIRMVGDFDQMKERHGESLRMGVKGYGSRYRLIIEEFLEKMEALAPEDFEARAEVIAWMREHMPGIGKIKLLLLKEAAEHLKQEAPPEDVSKIADNSIKELEECERGLTAENLENVLARLELIRERLENARLRHPRARDRVKISIDVTVTVVVRVNVVWGRISVPENLEDAYTKLLAKFDNRYADLMSVLDNMPENTHGVKAAKVLAARAKANRDVAVALREAGRLRRAVARLLNAHRLLANAERIVMHITEWESEHYGDIAAWLALHGVTIEAWKTRVVRYEIDIKAIAPRIRGL